MTSHWVLIWYTKVELIELQDILYISASWGSSVCFISFDRATFLDAEFKKPKQTKA